MKNITALLVVLAMSASSFGVLTATTDTSTDLILDKFKLEVEDVVNASDSESGTFNLAGGTTITFDLNFTFPDTFMTSITFNPGTPGADFSETIVAPIAGNKKDPFDRSGSYMANGYNVSWEFTSKLKSVKAGTPEMPPYIDPSSKSLKSGKSAKSGKAKWKSIRFVAKAERKTDSGNPTVPDTGTTVGLLGLGLIAIFVISRRLRM